MEQHQSHKRPPKMATRDPTDSRVFVVVGGGPGGLSCVTSLRENGYKGRIIFICKEKYLPYDRTKLSKNFSTKIDDILLRPKEFYSNNSIECMMGVSVLKLNAEKKTVELSNGETIKFDSACMATGGNPRPIPSPGFNLKNIFQLRVIEDCENISTRFENKKVVIVGTSFIGMEAATLIAKKAASVVAIGMEKVPFERVLGLEIGTYLLKLHESNKVSFRLESVVQEFLGDSNGNVTHVVLKSGEKLEADICIVGAGIIPATEWASETEFKKERDQSIVADKYLCARPDIYVIGDLARFPYWLTGEMVRVEHYGMSQYQGHLAAQNMLGKKVEYHSVPFFWTVQYGKSLRYAGHALSYDQVLINGSLEEHKFVAYYVKGEEIRAVISIGRDPIASKAAELMHHGTMPTTTQLKKQNLEL